MSEAAEDIVAARVPRGTLPLLTQYVALLQDAAEQHNLIARSTVATIWDRHILDSLQLVDLAEHSGCWIDIGSGAGLPGLVAAILTGGETLLIEPRRLRVAFLEAVIEALGLRHVRVVARRSESASVDRPAAIISARAVAPLPALFAMAAHLADTDTQWLLPKGSRATAEVADAQRSWQGDLRLVPSLTEAQAMIVDARQVRRKGQQ